MSYAAFFKAVLRLGCLGFGGPAAVLSMTEEEFSRKKGWISGERFSELLAICKLFPGPVATQMVIALGRIFLGPLGGFLGGILFIAPAFLLVCGLSHWYLRSSEVISRSGLIWLGFQTGALAVIIASVIQLGRPYRRSTLAWLFGLGAAMLTAWRPYLEPAVIFGCGLLSYLSYRLRLFSQPLSWTWLGAFEFLDDETRSKLVQIFWICFKAGAFVFGTGLAVVPVLEGGFVQKMGWLTHAQFMDGLVMGQVTPGPVTITATFLGYQVLGLSGAVIATVGVFCAAFFNGVFLIPRILGHLTRRKTSGAAAFIAGAIPAVVGGVLGTGIRLADLTWNAVDSGALILIGIFILALIAQFWRNVPAWVVIPGAGLMAWFLERGVDFF